MAVIMKKKHKSYIKSILNGMPFGKVVMNWYRKHFTSIYKSRFVADQAGIKYELNEEAGLMDIDIRFERQKNGGSFEFPDMIATNKAIGINFINESVNRVINIGSGVGTFENINASLYPNVQFLASEMDEKCTEWTKSNRPYPNVKYNTNSIEAILNNEPKFDLAVCVDVIEHVKDYKSFLDEFSQLSDKAVITTPNRDRHYTSMYRPKYKYHVQEFNAGELFFILKMYYKKVVLYSAPDVLDTKLIEVGLYSTYNKLFAYCER